MLMLIESAKCHFRKTRMNEIATPRNFGILASVLFVAYALFGYFTDNIWIVSSRGTGPQYAHGEQAVLAALGYVSFAIAALVSALGDPVAPSERTPGREVSSRVIWAIVFGIVGIVLVGFRTPD